MHLYSDFSVALRSQGEDARAYISCGLKVLQ